MHDTAAVATRCHWVT